jgi:hypothetical protein
MRGLVRDEGGQRACGVLEAKVLQEITQPLAPGERREASCLHEPVRIERLSELGVRLSSHLQSGNRPGDPGRLDGVAEDRAQRTGTQASTFWPT